MAKMISDEQEKLPCAYHNRRNVIIWVDLICTDLIYRGPLLITKKKKQKGVLLDL